MSQTIPLKSATPGYAVKSPAKKEASSSSTTIPPVRSAYPDIFITSQATQEMDKISRELETKIKYLPEKDSSYKDKQWYSFIQSFTDYISRLPLICNIPLLGDKEFKQEFEFYSRKLKTSDSPPIENATTVLVEITKLLNRKGYMTDKSWRTISRTMQNLLDADIQHKIRKTNAPGLNNIDPFGFCPEILNNNNVRGLHPFVISALDDLPQLKDIERLNVHTREKLKSTTNNILTKATLKAYENIALRNLGLLINTKQPGEISHFEVDLLTSMIEQLPQKLQKEAKLALYGDQAITSENFIKSEEGNLLFHANRLHGGLLERLREEVSKGMDFNQRYIDSAFGFTKELSTRSTEMETFIKRLVKQDLMLEFPSGAAIQAQGNFAQHFSLSKKEEQNFADLLLTDPRLKYYRLAAADVLKENDILEPRTLEQKLASLGISARNLSYYDHHNMDALMARMDEVVMGQSQAKKALREQLAKLGTRETPLLYLDGAYGAGKTSMGLKLAQQLNTSLEKQRFGTGLESLEASSHNAHAFNAAVIPVQDLFNTEDPTTFRHDLFEYLKKAEANAQKFPGRPTVLIFDEVGRTTEEWQNPFHPEYDSQDTDIPAKKTMHTLFANALLQLTQNHQYMDAKTRKSVSFNNPVVFLTGNAGVETASGNPLHTPLFHKEFVGEQNAKALKSYFNQGNVVQFEPFTLDDRKGLVRYYVETMLPAAAALKGYHLNLPANFVDTLSKAYDDKGFVGRSINLHLEQSLMSLIYNDKKKPGDTVTIKIDPEKLQNLTNMNVNSNKPFVTS